MNTVNNKRRQQTISDIHKAYLNLSASRADIQSITVSDICKKAGINRTTFYSIYLNMNDLREDISDFMRDQFLLVYAEEAGSLSHSMNFDKLFRSIKTNQIFYKLYFKLGLDFSREFLQNDPSNIARHYYSDTKHIDYHVAFFSAGITAIIQKWLSEGCPGEPEEMSRILAEEYKKDNSF